MDTRKLFNKEEQLKIGSNIEVTDKFMTNRLLNRSSSDLNGIVREYVHICHLIGLSASCIGLIDLGTHRLLLQFSL
mgnify:CR=1 FL=1